MALKKKKIKKTKVIDSKYPIKVSQTLETFYFTIEQCLINIGENNKILAKRISEMQELLNTALALLHNSMIEPLDQEEKVIGLKDEQRISKTQGKTA